MSGRIVGVAALSAVIGGLAGALVAISLGDRLSYSSNDLDQDSLTIMDRLQDVRNTFRRDWPYVPYPENWWDDLYNSHEPLEIEFNSELWGLIQERGIDFARNKVEDWRERYALWVEVVDTRLQGLSESDAHYEALETIHFRGNRILDHVDAMLGG